MSMEARPTASPGANGGSPELSVVVPSHYRPLRLRWLLNALEEQTLDRARWEVIVVHDGSEPETGELLRTHALARAGSLREVRVREPSGPAPKRNAGWRAARGRTIVFTHDDCRPLPSWLERAMVAARRHEGAVVQGSTRPDPHERLILLVAAWPRTQTIVPPTVWAETSNILYPRALLERIGGLDGSHPDTPAEDTDLALRARAEGAAYVAAPDVLTFHAVEGESLRGLLRRMPRLQGFPYAVRRHPELRRHLPLGIFLKRTHAWLPGAVAAALLAPRRPAVAVLALPWLVHSMPRRGRHPRGLIRGFVEMPGRALYDLIELATMLRGSVAHRTLLL